MALNTQTPVELQKWHERFINATTLDISLGRRKCVNGENTVIFTVDRNNKFIFIFEKRIWKEDFDFRAKGCCIL